VGSLKRQGGNLGGTKSIWRDALKKSAGDDFGIDPNTDPFAPIITPNGDIISGSSTTYLGPSPVPEPPSLVLATGFSSRRLSIRSAWERHGQKCGFLFLIGRASVALVSAVVVSVVSVVVVSLVSPGVAATEATSYLTGRM
jgi:hypothetical protein